MATTKKKRVLIANRGLIQANCVRAVKELGATAITVYEEEDRDSAGVRNADEAHKLKVSDPRVRPYLDIDQIVELARRLKVDSVHPGYGFLAQNARFASRLAENGIELIAPPSRGAHNLSNKHAIKQAAARAGLPTLPGSELCRDADSLEAACAHLPFPLILKPAHGYGGIGLRVIQNREEIPSAFRALRSISRKFLLNTDEAYLERYLPDARHIEFPVLRDKRGRTVVFPEFDCSLQRRFQKLVVESPAPHLNADLRNRLRAEIRVLCERLDIRGFGSVEFLLRDGEAFFLEINGYIQPSHTATTLLTGMDLLKEQIRLLAGESLTFREEDIDPHASVIGAHVFAEDPENNFEPSPGTVDRLYLPFGEEVFLQTSIFSTARISPFYDPMVAKLIVRGRSRDDAILRLNIALEEFFVEGVKTNIPLLRGIVSSDAYRNSGFTPESIENPDTRRALIESLKSDRDCEIAALVAALALHRDGDTLKRVQLAATHSDKSVLSAATRWLRPRKKRRNP